MTSQPAGLALTVWVPNTPIIFSIATNAAKGITALPRVGGQNAALVSVVFAAASLEALINESAYVAESVQREVVEPPVVAAFAQVMGEAEESRGQIQSKFQLAYLALTGKPYDKGTAPFQDFSLLIEARNALLHFKSKEYFSQVDGKPAVFNQVALVEKLSSKKILHEMTPSDENALVRMWKGSTAQFTAATVAQSRAIIESENLRYNSSPDALRANWTLLLGTKAVAEWACNTAAEMALDFIGKAPDSLWKTRMEGHFRPVFSVPLK